MHRDKKLRNEKDVARQVHENMEFGTALDEFCRYRSNFESISNLVQKAEDRMEEEEGRQRRRRKRRRQEHREDSRQERHGGGPLWVRASESLGREEGGPRLHRHERRSKRCPKVAQMGHSMHLQELCLLTWYIVLVGVKRIHIGSFIMEGASRRVFEGESVRARYSNLII